MTLFQRFLKRGFDVGVSAVGLCLLFVPLTLIGLWIKISSPGPMLFRQERIGRKGRPFSVIKFRTMFENAERSGTITTARDARITPLGTLLRRFKLDEFPQLWNVFLGRMSFVGPRPDVSGYADKLEGDSRKILDLLPGITGPASLYFRNEEQVLADVKDPKAYNDFVIWPKKIELNLEYYENWSFWKDIGYILITLFPGLDRIFGLIPIGDDETVEK